MKNSIIKCEYREDHFSYIIDWNLKLLLFQTVFHEFCNIHMLSCKFLVLFALFVSKLDFWVPLYWCSYKTLPENLFLIPSFQLNNLEPLSRWKFYKKSWNKTYNVVYKIQQIMKNSIIKCEYREDHFSYIVDWNLKLLLFQTVFHEFCNIHMLSCKAKRTRNLQESMWILQNSWKTVWNKRSFKFQSTM